jgi:hypothetical protein
MASSFKYTTHGHYQHNDIDDNSGEHVKTMKPSNGKKEVCEILVTGRAISIMKRIATPPCTFMK